MSLSVSLGVSSNHLLLGRGYFYFATRLSISLEADSHVIVSSTSYLVACSVAGKYYVSDGLCMDIGFLYVNLYMLYTLLHGSFPELHYFIYTISSKKTSRKPDHSATIYLRYAISPKCHPSVTIPAPSCL